MVFRLLRRRSSAEQVGTAAEQVGRQALGDGGAACAQQVLRFVLLRPGRTVQQHGQCIARLHPLLFQRALRRALRLQVLQCLAHFQARYRTGVEAGLHQFTGAFQAFQIGLAGRDRLVEIGQVPVLVDGVADHQQRGVLAVFLAGLRFPAGDVALGAQAAPQVHFPAQRDAGGVAAPPVVSLVGGAAGAAADAG